MTGPPILRAQGVHKTFRSRDRSGRRHETAALRGVDLEVPLGGSLAVVGESGSGKSTLARILVGLDAPDSGTVHLDGVDFPASTGATRRALQRQIQMIFQDPYRSLNPRMSVRSALRFAHHAEQPGADADEACRTMMQLVRLPESYLDRRPHSLSGGERQRVNIARALIARPNVVVADEAVSALDRSVQADILNLLADLRRELRLTLVYITHDVHTVSAVCEDVLVLHQGLVVERGRAATVMADPTADYTRALVAAAPTVDRPLVTVRPTSPPVAGVPS
ncbi:MAG: peptide transporter ATP-binding protein [Frankiales bacterium]|jgi:peptide/nickel transport system ATP-binding protein|nr:peptide transporter ATP-binding protein [Frankiales bacterium]